MTHIIPAEYVIQTGVRLRLPTVLSASDPVVWIGTFTSTHQLDSYGIQYIVNKISADTGVCLDWETNGLIYGGYIVTRPTTDEVGVIDVINQFRIVFGPNFTPHHQWSTSKI